MAKKLRIQHSAGPDSQWWPYVFHRVNAEDAGQKKHWWYQAVEGIQVLGEDKPRRTRGKPATATRIYGHFGAEIESAAAEFAPHGLWPSGEAAKQDVAVGDADKWDAHRFYEFQILIAAVIANESKGKLPADRYEKHLKDWSFGLTQTLTNTARGLSKNAGPRTAIPKLAKAGKIIDASDKTDPLIVEWKTWLEDPSVAIQLAAKLLTIINVRFKCKGDPMLVYAGYNAGSPRPTKTRTPWGLFAWDRDGVGPKAGALDHFAKWYGDTCAVWNPSPLSHVAST